MDAFWLAIKDRETPGWPPGKAFEYLILRMFELSGAEVRYPFSVRMHDEVIEQLDGVVFWKSLSCLIECKDYSPGHWVDFSPIAKMRNQMLRRPASVIGSVFSTSGFTEPAIILADYTGPQTILLWEPNEVEFSLNNRDICKGLDAKFRAFVETGFASVNLNDLDL